jgi:hypothetical protein
MITISFPESEINMATKSKSSRPGKVVYTVPDPEKLTNNVHAEVGGTATWKCNATKFLNFEVNFTGPNPSNGAKNAKFSGGINKPVVLPLNTPGQFKYKIKHIKADGTSQLSGPFPLCVAPSGEFSDRICKGCPPVWI